MSNSPVGNTVFSEQFNLTLPAAAHIGEVHIFDWRSNSEQPSKPELKQVIRCDDVPDISDLAPVVRDSPGHGLYVLVEQGSQPQALYSLSKEPLMVSESGAAALRIKREFVFHREGEKSIEQLPGVLTNLNNLGNTIITIKKFSRDERTPDQLCAAVAVRYYQERSLN